MKLGLDIHGVITSDTKFFSDLIKIFLRNRHEVHIITGKRITPELKANLDSYKIKYTKIFSITDYHLSIGTSVRFQDEDNPWIDDDTWNKTKAIYCEREQIDFHIDDSEVYGNYFKTPYCLMNKAKGRFEWFYKNNGGEFLFNLPQETYENISNALEFIKNSK